MPTADNLPRVLVPTRPQETSIVLTSPTQPTMSQHPYPTRHIISQSQEQANLTQVLEVANQQQWPDTHIKPTTFNFQHWAHAIIDPDTGAAMGTLGNDKNITICLGALKTPVMGQLYCGITINWNYDQGVVDLSMPGYIKAALHKFQHPTPPRPQHAPHEWTEPIYGKHQQMALLPDATDKLPPERIQRIQKIVCTLLYYAQAVDSTQLVALGTIAAQQANGTIKTEKSTAHLLDYCHTHPDAVLRYRASDIILKVHSNASYLSEARARSRATGHFYLGDKQTNAPKRNNGALLTKSTIMKNVMSSAADAETRALFENTTNAVPLRNKLKEMGHPQPPTPVQVDNSTTNVLPTSK
jgi:hypothetical protein